MSTLSQSETNDLLRVVDVTTSTNDDAREAAREGAPHGSAIAARVQTAGRGRRGHVWESPRGSLYLSCVLRPSVPMHFFTGLPAVCALGVLDCLRDDLGIAQAALKWPNDIIAGPSKLAGILVEAGSSAMGTFAVCGVGVNVATAMTGTVSQAQVTPEANAVPSPEALARTCLEELVEDPSKLPAFEDIAELFPLDAERHDRAEYIPMAEGGTAGIQRERRDGGGDVVGQAIRAEGREGALGLRIAAVEAQLAQLPQRRDRGEQGALGGGEKAGEFDSIAGGGAAREIERAGDELALRVVGAVFGGVDGHGEHSLGWLVCFRVWGWGGRGHVGAFRRERSGRTGRRGGRRAGV